jgi:hypothetical protein
MTIATSSPISSPETRVLIPASVDRSSRRLKGQLPPHRKAFRKVVDKRRTCGWLWITLSFVCNGFDPGNCRTRSLT